MLAPKPSQHLESYSPQIRNPFRFNQAVNRSSQPRTQVALLLKTADVQDSLLPSETIPQGFGFETAQNQSSQTGGWLRDSAHAAPGASCDLKAHAASKVHAH